MRARKGDHLVVESRSADLPSRDGEIIRVRGSSGEPPYDVRWSDTGQVGLVFPGPDAHVTHPEDDDGGGG